jgi:hypothetical protein
MKRHLAYLKYLLRHKWFVYLACRKCGVSLWRAIIYDWHKFLPSEWQPYARTFYNPDGTKAKYSESMAFAVAWNYHQKRGKHHWQYWLITWDKGITEPVIMLEKYWREMVADWWGAGRAITGAWDARGWYLANADKIKLHPYTRKRVEELLEVSQNRILIAYGKSKLQNT